MLQFSLSLYRIHKYTTSLSWWKEDRGSYEWEDLHTCSLISCSLLLCSRMSCSSCMALSSSLETSTRASSKLRFRLCKPSAHTHKIKAAAGPNRYWLLTQQKITPYVKKTKQTCVGDFLSTHSTNMDTVGWMTHTALSNVGGEVLLQDAPLSLGGLQLHILLVEHWLQVSHFTLEPGDLLLHLNTPEKTAPSVMQIIYSGSHWRKSNIASFNATLLAMHKLWYVWHWWGGKERKLVI